MSKGRHWKREMNKCVLCGKYVAPWDKMNGVTGITGKVVCSSCLRISNKIFTAYEEHPDYTHCVTQNPEAKENVLTPAEIIKGLDHSIIGQEEAKKAVAVAMWKQSLRAKQGLDFPKLNLLVYGPTGCGKTAIVQAAANIVGLPFITFDASTLTQAGYRGRDACDVVKDLVSRYKGKDDVQNAVVFLDEIDKLAANGSEFRKEYARGDQHSLLKLLEGESYEIDDKWISTKNMLFVFGGAFTGLYSTDKEQPAVKQIGFLPAKNQPEEPVQKDISVEDLIRYGMEPELMGRIGQIVPVHALTEKDLAQILLKSERSTYLEYKRFFSRSGIELTLSESEAEELAKQALARGTGARGLNALIEYHVEPLLLRFSEGNLRGKVSVMEGGAQHERVS